jgi:HD-GYP domain-containing protein (c-di-GMP phosphodiesterase class II)
VTPEVRARAVVVVRGLVGEAIPLASRIIAVADAYDAMTTSRPYRAALPRETAIAELRGNAGTQFDSAVVVAALKVLNRAAPDAEAVAPAAVTPRPA